jgi:hypothetical protein
VSKSLTLRIGAAPTPEQLLPWEYVCANGKRMRVTLTNATSPDLHIALPDTYTYEGRPANGMQLDLRPGTKVLTKARTELNGAIRVFCCSGIAIIDFEERKPPFPKMSLADSGPFCS